MNNRLLMIVAVALLIATGTSYVVWQLVRSRIAANAVPVSNQIVIASRTLDTGTMVKESDLSVGSWVGNLPKGYIRTTKEVVGRGIISTVYEGEPVTDSRLAAPGGGAGLAATIPTGMRACAVRVNEIIGVAGFVVPGMRVDVLIAGTSPNATQAGPRVKTLLQNVEVLSAGQNYQKDAEGKPVLVPVVNLLVTPAQAETLSLASNETRIQLVLRNPLDSEVSQTPGSAMEDLFNEPRPKPAPAPVTTKVHAPVVPQPAPIAALPVKQSQLVEVLNGSKKTEATFTKTEEQ